MRSFYDCGCKLEVYLLNQQPLDIMESVSIIPFLFCQENQIPYDLQLSETDLIVLFMEFLKCYEFYELSPTR